MKNSKKITEKFEQNWSETADFFESDDSLSLLNLSSPVSPEEHRQLLGAGNRKAISIRIPENDLEELQKIAQANGRKYQQLIVKAIELYIDNYHRLIRQKENHKKS